MTLRACSLLVLALGTVSAPGAALAQNHARGARPAESFGIDKHVAISSDASLSVQRSTTSGVSGATTSIQLSPALDYFSVDSFSIGGFVGASYTTTGDDHSTRFSIGPRVGYHVVVSDMFSVWPKVGFSYAATTSTVDQAVGATTVAVTTRNSNVTLNLFAPFMVHPAPHFFAGFGPFLDTDVRGDARTRVWGGKLLIGGWI